MVKVSGALLPPLKSNLFYRPFTPVFKSGRFSVIHLPDS